MSDHEHPGPYIRDVYIYVHLFYAHNSMYVLQCAHSMFVHAQMCTYMCV